MGLRAGLDRCIKSRLTGIRFPDRPARRQSLYRLRYPAHTLLVTGLIVATDIFRVSNVQGYLPYFLNCY